MGTNPGDTSITPLQTDTTHGEQIDVHATRSAPPSLN
jgi:hypothetical protein